MTTANVFLFRAKDDAKPFSFASSARSNAPRQENDYYIFLSSSAADGVY